MIDFVYAENTNLPVILESKKLNLLSFAQHIRFLNWVKRNRIPLGYFYRDIRWRFPFYTSVLHGPLAHLLKPLNWIDWYIIDRTSDILYLPSEEMNKWLPRPRKENTYRALPPGYNQARCLPSSETTSGKVLRLVYVGGLNKPVYSFSRALKVIYNHNLIHLTLCCREDEWNNARDELEPLLGHNVSVVHLHHDALSSLYRTADIFLLAMDPCEYWEFSFPVKFAESIGFGVPVVCCRHQAAIASVIVKERIGWVIDAPEDLIQLAESDQLPAEIREFKENVAKFRDQFSWLARARAVSADLSAKNSKI